MGIFDANAAKGLVLEQELKNPNELMESLIYDELSMLSEQTIQKFVKSDEAKAMVESGLIGRKTLVRLSKRDDLERRIGMACIQMAKENDDILYDQLIKNRIKEKEILDKINAKYTPRASRLAIVGQRDFLKQKLPISFVRK